MLAWDAPDSSSMEDIPDAVGSAAPAYNRSRTAPLLPPPIRSARERYASARECLMNSHEAYAWAVETGEPPQRIAELLTVRDAWQDELDEAALAVHLAERAHNGTGGGA